MNPNIYPQTESASTFNSHGQLIIGAETIYLSHLPLFMFNVEQHPQDFQVILEATLSEGGNQAQAVYVNDRRRTGTKIYTLATEGFTLTDLVSPDPEQPGLRSLKGTIFRGHFERGGVPILADVGVNVTKVVYFQQFKPNIEPLPQLTYLLFGRGHELFLAHVMTKLPDFDQILSAHIVGHTFTDEQLRQGVRFIFPGRANSSPGRLREGEQLLGEIQLAGENVSETLALQVEAGVEFYFEERELPMPM